MRVTPNIASVVVMAVLSLAIPTSAVSKYPPIPTTTTTNVPATNNLIKDNFSDTKPSDSDNTPSNSQIVSHSASEELGPHHFERSDVHNSVTEASDLHSPAVKIDDFPSSVSNIEDLHTATNNDGDSPSSTSSIYSFQTSTTNNDDSPISTNPNGDSHISIGENTFKTSPRKAINIHQDEHPTGTIKPHHPFSDPPSSQKEQGGLYSNLFDSTESSRTTARRKRSASDECFQSDALVLQASICLEFIDEFKDNFVCERLGVSWDIAEDIYPPGFIDEPYLPNVPPTYDSQGYAIDLVNFYSLMQYYLVGLEHLFLDQVTYYNDDFTSSINNVNVRFNQLLNQIRRAMEDVNVSPIEATSQEMTNVIYTTPTSDLREKRDFGVLRDARVAFIMLMETFSTYCPDKDYRRFLASRTHHAATRRCSGWRG